MSDAQVRAHFDAAFLAQVSPAMLNQALQGATGVKLLSIQVSEPSTLIAIVSTSGVLPRAQVALTVDSQGLISGLRISPATTAPTPATWAGVDAALRSVAPQVRLLVANVSNGSCQPVHSIDPAAAAPLGSLFKLYVLDALGSAVASGTVHWNQLLTVTAQLKSLPSGQLQNEPDGTQISVQHDVLSAVGRVQRQADCGPVSQTRRVSVGSPLTLGRAALSLTGSVARSAGGRGGRRSGRWLRRRRR